MRSAGGSHDASPTTSSWASRECFQASLFSSRPWPHRRCSRSTSAFPIRPVSQSWRPVRDHSQRLLYRRMDCGDFHSKALAARSGPLRYHDLLPRLAFFGFLDADPRHSRRSRRFIRPDASHFACSPGVTAEGSHVPSRAHRVREERLNCVDMRRKEGCSIDLAGLCPHGPISQNKMHVRHTETTEQRPQPRLDIVLGSIP
jgi:hypothetical protein